MSARLEGIQKFWKLSEDAEANRTYKIIFRVITSNPLDGPFTVRNCPGLPVNGAVWAYGTEIDPWAFCTFEKEVDQITEGGKKSLHWDVTCTFTTRAQFRKCGDTPKEDPLLEPQKVNGSFVKYVREAARDRNGRLIRSTSHELFKGAQVEFDRNRPRVHVEQNVLDLQLDLCAGMVDHLNDSLLWGVGPRRVKFSDFSWERKIYGACGVYFTRIFDFDIDMQDDDLFDRHLLDQGTKALSGRWATEAENALGINGWVLINVDGAPPDKDNPQHFVRYKDRHGENVSVVLDEDGLPADSTILSGTGTGSSNPSTPSGPAHLILFEYYQEANLYLLGIPATLT